VRPEKAIQKNFQYFKINDDESGVNKKVQNGYQRIPEHFFLSEGQQQNILPSRGRVITKVFFFS
jgi:hypothetical protein